ncbi:hypothetical protein OEW28_16405 [Defluviimonas sp. WL0002]|uniref:Bile acid:sodium symporter n=1 Tax=Albidovulum marisflavi TaxID=2984159 RepID=A0ABT2ZGF1_9RHOB|nr:hypothetical protein [Defluviimonas sp. WL0002]MCV2870209.1 hypothetical protein [Defluviimonas sp. WL0002]
MTGGGLLRLAARHGRLLLILGLLAGASLPDLARDIAPWLGPMAAALIGLAAFRIGLSRAVGALSDLVLTLRIALALQFLLPLTALGCLWAAGLLHRPEAAIALLVMSAPPVGMGPGLAVLSGLPPEPALRQLVLGTALLPLTALPVLAALPGVGAGTGVLIAEGRLLATILLGAGAGFALRALLLPEAREPQIRAADGAGAMLGAVIVIGLMAEVGPVLVSDPLRLGYWLAFAFALNLGLQAATSAVLRARGAGAEAGTFGIVAGNRNVLLFLVALPPEVFAPLMVFVGCYQVPMYLTPLFARGLHRARAA